MKSKTLIALVAMSVIGCGDSSDETVFTREDRALLRSMALSPSRSPPTDIGNDLYVNGSSMRRASLALLGQQLFFDPELSTPRADGSGVSCAECHSPTHWFSDGRGETHVSDGVGWTGRNSPSLVNVGYYLSFGWDGRADSLWAQGKHAFEAPATMAGDRLHLARQLARRYENRFFTVFDEQLPRELLSDAPISEAALEHIYRNVLKCWSAYLLQLNSGDSAFDAFANGDETALTPEQRRGLHLFIGKAGCINCHLGPHFTDNQYHALGLEQTGAHVPGEDLGRFTGITKLNELPADYRLFPTQPNSAAERGKFRTKSLRHVAQTAPYFHAGQMATLAEVVWFYNQGGLNGGAGMPSPFVVPLGLTEPEQSDLVAFLGSITGTPVPAGLACNNSRSNAGVGPRCEIIP